MRPERSTRSRKTSLPMSRRAEHASGERAASRLGAAPRVGLGAHAASRRDPESARDLVAVRDSRSGMPAVVGRVAIEPSALARSALRPSVQACGPSVGVSSSSTTSKPCALVEREVLLGVRQQSAREAGALGGLEPGREQRAADAAALRAPARRRSRRGTSAGRHRPRAQVVDGAAVREEARRRLASRSGVATSARSAGPTRTRGRPGGNQRAQPRTGPRVVQTSAVDDVEADAEEPRQERLAAAPRPAAPSPRRVVLERPREHRARLLPSSRRRLRAASLRCRRSRVVGHGPSHPRRRPARSSGARRP